MEWIGNGNGTKEDEMALTSEGFVLLECAPYLRLHEVPSLCFNMTEGVCWVKLVVRDRWKRALTCGTLLKRINWIEAAYAHEVGQTYEVMTISVPVRDKANKSKNNGQKRAKHRTRRAEV
ncbi:hypothetical protein Tco_0900273 [Tanacetum coccineum]